MADFPIALTNAVDGVPGVGTEILAKHLNNLEAKVGIDSSAVSTSLDYLLKNTASIEPGHKHYQLWKPDGSSQALTVDSNRRVRIASPAVNTPNLLLDDGLGTLAYTTLSGYNALLTLNIVDGVNDFQLFYIAENTGKIANFTSTGNMLYFQHYSLLDALMGGNALLGFGGSLFQGPIGSIKGIYNLSANQIGIGVVSDYVTPASNTPVVTISTDHGNIGIGVTAWGTSAAKVLGMAAGTAPSTAPAGMAQLWAINLNGASTAGFRFMNQGATTVYTMTGVSGVTAASTGVGSVKMGSVNAANNAGWLTMLNHLGVVVYVPYWTNQSP